MTELVDSPVSFTGNIQSEMNPNRESICPTKENIGRWDEAEHKLFLEGLTKYGNDWKQIANMIATRNLVQVRTHAQKYFQKLNKNANSKTSFPEVHKRKESLKPQAKEESPRTASLVSSPSSTRTIDSNSSSTIASPNLSVSVTVKSAPVVQHTEPTPVRSQPKTLTSSTEFNLFDVDIISDYSRAPYSTISMFDNECNTNVDDMEYFSSLGVHTPVFDLP